MEVPNPFQSDLAWPDYICDSPFQCKLRPWPWLAYMVKRWLRVTLDQVPTKLFWIYIYNPLFSFFWWQISCGAGFDFWLCGPRPWRRIWLLIMRLKAAASDLTADYVAEGWGFGFDCWLCRRRLQLWIWLLIMRPKAVASDFTGDNQQSKAAVADLTAEYAAEGRSTGFDYW